MAFLWSRRPLMPLDQPTDEMITDYIKKYDSPGHFQRVWHEWRDIMLEGRDVFHGKIPRHSPMPLLPKGHNPSPVFQDKNWTPLERNAIGARNHISHIHDQGPDYCLCLEPISRAFYQESPHLLGLEMASGRIAKWGRRRFFIHGGIKHHSGYTEWVRYILRNEREMLRKAGIVDAVMLSMFDYAYDENLLKAIHEHWNPKTNTCYLFDDEVFPSLWDMKYICGLPILGVRYDEYVPDDKMLFGETSYGEFRQSSSLKKIFYHYYDLFRRYSGTVSIRHWILRFVDIGSASETDFPSPCDPFGIGSEDILVQDSNPPSRPSIAAGDMDRETFLTAFLSCWLCYFVVPYRYSNRIRPEVFVTANKLARGVRISLASAALSNLFRSLREACTADPPGEKGVLIPTHHLFGWFNLQFHGLYNTVVSDNMKSRLPHLIHLAGALPICFREFDARLIFRKTDVLCHHQSIFSNKKGLLSEQMECQDSDFETMTTERLTSLEFLISIRAGWLPFRSGNDASFEAYNPHRCARQFGYDQVIPQGVLDFEKLSGDLLTVAECWQTLLRQRTGSFYTIPARNRPPKCSFEYLRWHSMQMRALLGYRIPDIYDLKNSISRRFLKRPVSVSGQKYGFEFDLSQSTSSKRLKALNSKAAPSNLNKSKRHIFNSGDGELSSDNIPSKSAVNENLIGSAIQQVGAPVDDIFDAEGPSNIIDLVKPSVISSDSSGDVIGALKGIVRAPKELIEKSTFCADPASLPTTSDAATNLKSIPSIPETVVKGTNPADEDLSSRVQDISAQDENPTADVSTPVIPTDSDEFPDEIEVLPEIISEFASYAQEFVKGNTGPQGTVDTQHCIQDLAQQTVNLPATGLASNMQVVQIENMGLLKHGDILGHVPNIQEMPTGDKSSSIDGLVPSSSQQIHTATNSQVPQVIHPSFERAARFLISDNLKIFDTKDTFPSVEDFLALSDNISHALVGLRVPLDIWENSSGQILTILKRIESSEGLDVSEIDSQISKEEEVLQDSRSLQDALSDRKNDSIAFCESTRVKITQADAQIRRIEEERLKLLSSLHEEETSLRNTEDTQESNSEFIAKTEAQLNSLIERRKLVFSIEEQKSALKEIIKKF